MSNNFQANGCNLLAVINLTYLSGRFPSWQFVFIFDILTWVKEMINRVETDIYIDLPRLVENNMSKLDFLETIISLIIPGNDISVCITVLGCVNMFRKILNT